VPMKSIGSLRMVWISSSYWLSKVVVTPM
jgi:hypothetical protein